MPIDYVELHCHSAFSLLYGTSTPADLVAQAAYLGMDALALTDHNAVYGVVPFVTAARTHSIHPILGAELTMEDGHHLTLLVADQTGWRNLCVLISRAQANAPKGQAALPLDVLQGHTEGDHHKLGATPPSAAEHPFWLLLDATARRFLASRH